MLTIGSLFSGIGGLELGLEWAGLGPVVFQCEIDPLCRTVLAKHWPYATRFNDVRSVDESSPRVDILCGGFPCQDISDAGTKRGLAGTRSGLWTEFARVVRVLRPRFVVVENVTALAGRGLDVVLGDLAACRFDAVWFPLRASGVGAAHERERLFVVAYAHGELGEARAPLQPDDRPRPLRRASHPIGFAPTQKDAEDELLRALDGPAAWVDRHAEVHAIGNAVVPQCAQVVGEVIREMLGR